MKFDYHPCLPSLSLSVFLPCRYNYPPSRRLPLFSQTPIHTHRNLYRLPSYVSNVLSVARKPPALLLHFLFLRDLANALLPLCSSFFISFLSLYANPSWQSPSTLPHLPSPPFYLIPLSSAPCPVRVSSAIIQVFSSPSLSHLYETPPLRRSRFLSLARSAAL